ncbi:hypothetical protein BU16DRAFT_269771 [Lophium mytilinum]|uniref:Uncharacterized protein n=1 Tax=Lophium mytilinum TaxID=390894 RepID=A0A6A6R6Q8_9PEZI|nr:hypothetical protein BU16DRAFT_269771 [Lophium mytilinum]
MTHVEEYRSASKRSSSLWTSDSALVDLYIFADKYDMPQLRVDVIDMVHQENTNCIHFVPNIYAVAKAFENLPPQSGLYRYFFDVYVGQWDEEAITTCSAPSHVPVLDMLPKSLLAAIMLRRSAELKLVNVPDFPVPEYPFRPLPPLPYERSLCSYHDHARNEGRGFIPLHLNE